MAIVSFADYSDVCTRLNDSSLDEEQVEALIEDASAMLLALLGSRYDEDDEVQARNLQTVCCNMVARALTATLNSAGFGVSQHSMTVSSFNEQVSYANPSGDLYLTSLEKKLLGIGASAVFTVEPSIRPGYPLTSSVEPE